MLVLHGIAHGGSPATADGQLVGGTAGGIGVARGDILGTWRGHHGRRIGVEGLHLGVKTVQHGFELRIGGEGLPANPSLGRAGTESLGDDAHGDFDFRLQIAGEEVAHGGEARDGLRRADQPVPAHAVSGGISFGEGAGEHADERVICGGDFGLLIGDAGEIFYFFGHAEIHI